MQKKLRVVVPTPQGVALFLAHGTSTEGYLNGIKKLIGLGMKVIVSDPIMQKLSEEGYGEGIIPMSKYSIHEDVYGKIGMKPVLPEAVIIGMTADLHDEAVKLSLKEAGIPEISLVVIDPSYLASKRDGLMSKVKEGLSVSADETIEAITPTVTSAVTSATKAGRIVVMSEQGLQKTMEHIETGSLRNAGFAEEFFLDMAAVAFGKFVGKSTRYIKEALEALTTSKAQTA
jgi:hypothetical protein